MASKHDYHALLSIAVSGLDRDAYAARGAVYDREHKALLRKWFAPDSELTDADIDEEQAAFREAVRRIEFGDQQDLIPFPSGITPAREVVAPPPPEIPSHPFERGRPVSLDPSRPSARKIDWSIRDPLPDQRPAGAAPSKAANGASVKPAQAGRTPVRKRSVFGRVTGRTLFALVLISLGITGYGYVTGQIKLPWLARVVGDGATSGMAITSNRAILFDGDVTDVEKDQTVGVATWRTTVEPGRDTGALVSVLHLDAQIPQRKLLLKFSMQPEVPGGAMSHLIHLRFVGPDGRPDEQIADIGGILTRTSSTQGRNSLAGSLIKVAPGVFLFGLDGHPGARELSLRQLKEMNWLDIPLTYSNGTRGVLAIEKDGTGGQTISGVLSKWDH
ncbi:MAG: hypothetical protein ACRECO_15205 [Xanthobacteraceae bacterium]